jgi:hypothetical protein
MQRLAIQLTTAALAVALVAGGYLLTSTQNRPGQSQQGSSVALTQSQSGQQNSCVQAGEPLYPSTELVPLSNFTLEWGGRYTISVNSTAHTVLVQGANGVGSISLKSVTFELLSC